MKSGFISIVGRPNVGKSTIINAIVGTKVAITTSKPQTTRNIIRGILTTAEAQLIFIDTPGIHKPYLQIGNEMNKMAYHSLREAEATILVVDAGQSFGPGDQFLIDNLTIRSPLFIVFNKIDLATFASMEKLKSIYKEKYPAAHQIEVSAIRNVNLDVIVAEIIKILPEGPQYFPSDMTSDRGDDFLISEVIRERIMLLTRQEIPHSVAVNLVKKELIGDDKMDVVADIIVEKDSQKGILIGKGGRLIRQIRLDATKQLEHLLHKTIRMELFVRVKENWRDDLKSLKSFGINDEE